MLTEQIKRHLIYRLGTLDKYTIAGYFYWDKTQNGFAKRKGYTWFIFGAYAYFLLKPEQIPDEAERVRDSYNRYLLTLAYLLVLFVLCCSIVIVSSSELDHLPEVISCYNQGFKLNKILKNLLLPGGQLPEDRNQHFHDNLTKFVCYFPLLAPILFAGHILHPADPIHNLIKDVLEVRVELSFFIVVFVMPFVWYGAMCLVYHAIVGSLQVCVDIFLVEYWFDILMPRNIINVTSSNEVQEPQFLTAGLGVQTEQNLIVFYRTFQFYNKIVNANLSTNRIASHSIGLMAIAVFGSFTLIRYANLVQSLSELPLMIIMFLSVAVVLVIYSLECSNLDALANRSLVFKNRLLKMTKKTAFMHKTAKSFRVVTLKLGGPFFNVNKSTFLDWFLRVLDNLVTVLVTF